MHIAFLNPHGNFDPADRYISEHSDFGGQLVYVRETAIALAERGHTVDLVTRRIDDVEWQGFSDPTANYPGQSNARIVRIECGNQRFIQKEGLWPFLEEWVENLISFYDGEGIFPDVAAAMSADGGLAAVMINQRRSLPFTFTAHSLGATQLNWALQNDVALEEAAVNRNLHRKLAAERLTIEHAGKLIVSTEYERYRLYSAREYKDVVNNKNDARFSRIPPGVNLKVFGKDERAHNEDEVRERIGSMLHQDIAHERRHLPLVICSSRLDKDKNILGLLRAWAENETLMAAANLAITVRRHTNPFHAPEGAFPPDQEEILDNLRELLDERNLWPCVMTVEVDSQQELAAVYRTSADTYKGVLALVSLYEPFGLSLLEAMAAGLPVVATKNGGPAEILADDYGLLADPTDPDDISAKLLKLIKRDEMWKRYHDLGPELVQNQYTWDRTAREYEAVLEELVSGDKGKTIKVELPQWLTDLSRDGEALEWLKNIVKT